jgi:hypothetical protein
MTFDILDGSNSIPAILSDSTISQVIHDGHWTNQNGPS